MQAIHPPRLAVLNKDIHPLLSLLASLLQNLLACLLGSVDDGLRELGKRG